MSPNPSSRPLWIRLFGLLLVMSSTVGIIFALNPSRGAGRPQVSPAESEGTMLSVVIYGNVDVESGVTPLFPLQPGRVLEVKVKENESVKKGNVILRMDDRLARSRLRQAQADHAAAVAQLNLAVKLPEQHQLKITQQKLAVAAAQHKLEAARHELEQKLELVQAKQINQRVADAAGELVKALESGLRAEQAKLKELELFDPQEQVRRAEADAADKQAQLDQAQLALDECNLVAPTDGMVLQVLVGPGSVLGTHPTQPAVIFCADQPRIVRAEVEQEFAGRLAVGQYVEVQDEFGSSPVRTGKITRLANWYTRARSQSLDPTKLMTAEVRTLECIISLDQDAHSFRLGQRVRVKAGRPATQP